VNSDKFAGAYPKQEEMERIKLNVWERELKSNSSPGVTPFRAMVSMCCLVREQPSSRMILVSSINVSRLNDP